MQIKDVGRVTGLTNNNIRFYEKVGLIHPDRNEINGYRDYSERDIEQLKKIVTLRKLDFSIEQIKAILKEQVSLSECLKLHEENLESEKKRLGLILDVVKGLSKNEHVNYEEVIDSRLNHAEASIDEYASIHKADIISILPEGIKSKLLKNHLLNHGYEDVLETTTSYIDKIITECLNNERTIISLINSTDDSTKSDLVNLLKKGNPDLYIRYRLYVHDIEQLIAIPCNRLKTALEGFSQKEIMVALKAMSPKLKVHVAKSISNEAIIDSVNKLGILPLREVTEVHDRILCIINQQIDKDKSFNLGSEGHCISINS